MFQPHEILALLFGIWLFSRWRPIQIQYYRNNRQVNTNEMTSGAKRAWIMEVEK